MQLARLVIVHISPKVEELHVLEIGQTDVGLATALYKWDSVNSSAVLLAATMRLRRRPVADPSGLIRVPQAQRRQLVFAIALRSTRDGVAT